MRMTTREYAVKRRKDMSRKRGDLQPYCKPVYRTAQH